HVANLRRPCSKTKCPSPVRVEYSSGRGICFAPKVLTLVDMLEKTALPDPDHAVVVRSLGKQFGEKVAVNGVNLTIPAGSFYGVVGPNGAGKTTAMSMMTGLRGGDHWQVWIQCYNMWGTSTRAKASLGVLGYGHVAFTLLTGAQLITSSRLSRGMHAGGVACRVSNLMRLRGLEQSANKMVADYS